MEFGYAERRRVERNLHDGAQQRLVNLSLALGIARSQIPTTADGELAAALDEAAEELRLALAELRELARGIHPVILSEAGLARRWPRWLTVTDPPPSQRPRPAGSRPGSRKPPTTSPRRRWPTPPSTLRPPWSPSAPVAAPGASLSRSAMTASAAPTPTARACGLADRVAALDGHLRVDSPTGCGTRITAELPCGS